MPWLEPVELAFGLIALCAIRARCIPEQQLDKLIYISSSNMVFLFLPIALYCVFEAVSFRPFVSLGQSRPTAGKA